MKTDSAVKRGTDRARQYTANTGGFTLTEVMVATLILGLVMGGFFQVTSMSRRMRAQAQHHYVAVIVANNRIERAKHMRLADVALLQETDTVVNELGAPDPDGQYLRTTVIEPDYDGESMLMRIRVSVQPPAMGYGNSDRPVETVSTVLTEYLEP